MSTFHNQPRTSLISELQYTREHNKVKKGVHIQKQNSPALRIKLGDVTALATVVSSHTSSWTSQEMHKKAQDDGAGEQRRPVKAVENRAAWHGIINGVQRSGLWC